MRATSIASLLLGIGIGFAPMFIWMQKRAPEILKAMPPQFVPASAGGARSAPPLDTARLKQLQDDVSKDPKDFNALRDLGDLHADQEQFADAANWYTQALAVRESAVVRKDLGIALYSADRVDDAIVQFRKALETEPAMPEALYYLGVALLKDDAAGALAMWERFVELNPNHPEVGVVKRQIQSLKEKRP